MKIYIHDAGDCQKCGMTLYNFINNNPKIKIVNDPEKCNLLIIIGCLLMNQEQFIVKIWNKATNSKVLLFGDCPAGKSELFSHKIGNLKNLAISEKIIEELIPIDDTLEGCPPNFKDLEDYIINKLKKFK